MNHSMNRDDYSKFNTMFLSLKENKSPTKFQISVFLNRENSSEVFFLSYAVYTV